MDAAKERRGERLQRAHEERFRSHPRRADDDAGSRTWQRVTGEAVRIKAPCTSEKTRAVNKRAGEDSPTKAQDTPVYRLRRASMVTAELPMPYAGLGR
jgi:hypothetical protein